MAGERQGGDGLLDVGGGQGQDPALGIAIGAELNCPSRSKVVMVTP